MHAVGAAAAVTVLPLAPALPQCSDLVPHPAPPTATPLQRLSAQIREAIQEQRYPEFVRQYVARQFPRGDVPQWVRDGCQLAGISLQGVATAPAPEAEANAAAAADSVPNGGAAAAVQQQRQQRKGRQRQQQQRQQQQEEQQQQQQQQ